MADYKGVLVFCETIDDKLSSISTELLGCGKQIASDLGEELAGVILGSGVAEVAAEMIVFGADKAYSVDDAVLKDYQGEVYAQVMEKVSRQVMPQIIILGQTTVGRDLAPRLAFKLNTAATLDCIELSLDSESKQLLQTKPVYGGNARAVFTTDAYPKIATLRAKVASPLAPDSAKKGEIVNIPAGIELSSIKAKTIEKVKEEVAGIKLEDAKVIVAGGRGIGNAEGFKQLEELASILKGAVGASRPPCDNKWVPDTAQIGLTGKIVTPDLYFAVGLSGSSQHMAGCSGAKTIVAINKDAEANVFKEAQFGIVGDWKKVIPTLTGKIKELVG